MTATSLSQTAMLAYLSIGSWSAKKLDKKASTKVTNGAGAVANAARVNKSLLAGADEKLQAVRKIGDAARRYLEVETLPWDDAGNRLLPNVKAFEVIAKIGEFKAEYYAAVDEFVAEYPIMREQAIAALGDLANDSDYPPTDQVRHRFSFRPSFTPLPTSFAGDVRFGLTPEQVTALERVGEARIREQTRNALDSAYRRLLDDLRQMASRLKRNDEGKYPIFRDSTVENVKATAESLGALNVFGDADLEALRQRVLTECCLFDANALRNSELTRDAVATCADTLVSDLLGMLGE